MSTFICSYAKRIANSSIEIVVHAVFLAWTYAVFRSYKKFENLPSKSKVQKSYLNRSRGWIHILDFNAATGNGFCHCTILASLRLFMLCIHFRRSCIHSGRLSLWGILFCLLVFGNKHELCGNLPVQKSSARVRRAKQFEREIVWVHSCLAILLNSANVSRERKPHNESSIAKKVTENPSLKPFTYR